MIIIQFIGLAAFLASLLSYWQKETKSILLTQALSALIYAVHYILLSGYSAAAVCIIGTVKSYAFANKDKYKSKLVLYVFLAIFLASGIITYDGVHSVIPSITSITYTVVSWSGNSKRIRLSIIVLWPLWLVYSVIIQSYVGIATETILMISTAISMWKLNIKSNTN